jgi:hypothetical protein
MEGIKLMDEPTICPICGHQYEQCCHDAEAVAAFEALLDENRELKQEIEQWKMTTAKLRVIIKDGRADRKRFTRLKDAVTDLIMVFHDQAMQGEPDLKSKFLEVEKRWKIVLGLEKDDSEPIPADSATVTALKQELEAARADVTAAAGEMLISIPKPGTDMARLFIVNRLLEHERDAIKQELDALKIAYDVRGETADEFLNDCAVALQERDAARASSTAHWHPATVLPPEDRDMPGYSIKIQVVDSGDVWSPCRLHLVTGRWYGPHGELMQPELWREVVV